MKKLKDKEKSKMRAISLTDEVDALLLQAGDGSRTAGIKELLELYQIVSSFEGTSYKEKKYKLIGLIQEKLKAA